MPAQAGKDLLLKLDIDDDGSFTTVGGLRATRVALNASAIDATSVDSAGRWRELLSGAGVRSASISGAGVFKDDASHEAVRAAFFGGTLKIWRIVVPSFGTMDGAFLVVSLDYAGDHDGEAAYELSLSSAGAVSFSTI